MSTDDWRRVSLVLDTDLTHGGRWTSLRSPDREWLWTNPDPDPGTARASVRPGDAFVDAGGVEECLPTIRGNPDHGDAWTRAWSGARDDARVGLPGLGVLERRITHGAGVRVDYRLTARPGARFLHAVHALLDLSPTARLIVPAAERMTVLDVPDPHRRWPDGMDELGPDDGSATCALLPGCREATVIDGDQALSLAWDAPGQVDSCSLLLWRNLGGWPARGPYRSIGIEPMVGRAADLSTADPADCASVDPSGHLDWTLTLTASSRPNQPDRTCTSQTRTTQSLEPERTLIG